MKTSIFLKIAQNLVLIKAIIKINQMKWNYQRDKNWVTPQKEFRFLVKKIMFFLHKIIRITKLIKKSKTLTRKKLQNQETACCRSMPVRQCNNAELSVPRGITEWILWTRCLIGLTCPARMKITTSLSWLRSK